MQSYWQVCQTRWQDWELLKREQCGRSGELYIGWKRVPDYGRRKETRSSQSSHRTPHTGRVRECIQ
eukprot:11684873-Prorocentrum_lima.AAC.1